MSSRQLTSQKITEKRLTPTQEAILDFVIRNPTATHATIARSLHLSREHVTRLMNSDEMKDRLRACHADIFRDAQQRAAMLSFRIVMVLQSIALNKNARNSERIRAAAVILDFAREGQRHRDAEAPFNLAREAAIAVIEAHRQIREQLSTPNIKNGGPMKLLPVVIDRPAGSGQV